MSLSSDRKLKAGRPKLILDATVVYCPGCQHGTAARVLAEAIEEMGIEGEAIGISAVGCSIMTHQFVDIDFIDALHGRAPCVATGIKHAHFGKPVVFTIQGDGDLAAIGMGDIINAIVRGERLTTIFLNNANYGTTGGQLAPTTLSGQITSTTPSGRDPQKAGYPLHVAEFLATLPGVAYSARWAFNNVAHYQRAKKSIKMAFQKQIEGIGYGFVELITACPAGWKKSPPEAFRWIEEEMLREYPLGEFKNVTS